MGFEHSLITSTQADSNPVAGGPDWRGHKALIVVPLGGDLRRSRSDQPRTHDPAPANTRPRTTSVQVSELQHRRPNKRGVQAVPFDPPGGGLTLCSKGIGPAMHAGVVAAACKLASRNLDEGDISGAERAVRRGLLASPWDERLYRMLMVVHHAAGNGGGVELALRSLARVLDWSGEPLEVVHPETAELYRELQVDRRARS